MHALQLAEEDLISCCGDLGAEEWNARPGGIAPLAFHARHIARSMDRLLSYAEGRQLDEAQITALKSELNEGAVPDEIKAELRAAFERAAIGIRALADRNLEEFRTVGRKRLTTTLGGLLVHLADHTQRHVGQAITTAKVVRAMRGT